MNTIICCTKLLKLFQFDDPDFGFVDSVLINEFELIAATAGPWVPANYDGTENFSNFQLVPTGSSCNCHQGFYGSLMIDLSKVHNSIFCVESFFIIIQFISVLRFNVPLCFSLDAQ